jgi:hypothetical protein
MIQSRNKKIAHFVSANFYYINDIWKINILLYERCNSKVDLPATLIINPSKKPFPWEPTDQGLLNENNYIIYWNYIPFKMLEMAKTEEVIIPIFGINDNKISYHMEK